MVGIAAGKTWSRIGPEVAPTSSAASGVWLINEAAENLGAGTWTSAPINMEFISKIVMDGTSNTVSFTSIPQQYRHLRIIGANLQRVSSSNSWIGLQFNNDSTTGNYGYLRLYNFGPTGGSQGQAGTGPQSVDDFPASSNDSAIIWDIGNYADSSVGTNCLVQWARDGFGGNDQKGVGGSNYQVASAVTRLDIRSNNTTSGYYLEAPGTFALFGIGKAA